MAKIELQRDLIKPKESQDKVLELINWIEEKEPEIFKGYDGIDFNFIFVSAFFVGIALITGLTVHDFAVSVVIGLAGFSGLIGYYSFFMQTIKGKIIGKRFYRAQGLKNFSDTDTVLLRALIKIKSKNSDINLKTLCDGQRS